MIAVERLSVSRSGQQVLNDFSLTVRAGEVAILIGPNGSGKSTALLAIAGRIPSERGRIAWYDSDASAVPGSLPEIGLLLQGGRVFPSMTVRDNLHVAGSRLKKPELRQRMNELEDELPPLSRLWHRTAGTLSGGERQLVAFAMTLVLQPRLLLLDEPLAGVDEDNIRALVRALSRLKFARRTVIVLIEHRQTLLQQLTDILVILDHGYSTQTRFPTTAS